MLKKLLPVLVLIIILEGHSMLSFIWSLYPPENNVAPVITVTPSHAVTEEREDTAAGI